MMADDRILITGGAGFIGSRLASALEQSAKEIVVFDNLHPQVHGENATPPDLPSNALFVPGDVTDAHKLAAVVGELQPNKIYHLAAETGTGQSYDEPARYNNVNIMGTAYLIEALRNSRTAENRPHVILAGSRAVYGEGAYKTPDGETVVGPIRTAEALASGRFTPERTQDERLAAVPTPENLPPQPASIYASTKLMQEYLLAQCAAKGDYSLAILRFQNVYGPGQSLKNPYTGVLSIFASQILAGQTLNIYEDGEIVRDFVFVDDVVRALVAAGTAEKLPAEPINIGSGYPATIREAAEIMLAELGAPTDRYRVSGDFRPGDVRYAVADIKKAEAQLQWRPLVRLPDGLSALARWVRTETDAAATT